MAGDTLSRIICDSLVLRAYAVNTIETTSKITAIHDTTPNATFALGNTINASALLAATLKPDSNQSVSLKFAGDGPLREVHVQSDARGNIRGYVSNPKPDLTDTLESISFSKAIGAGFITVLKDLGLNKPYSSITPLIAGDVAIDVAYYLTNSEQIPSALILGFTLDQEGKITSSGGILIQTFPDTPPEVIDIIEENLGKGSINLGEALRTGADVIAVLSEILGNEPLKILDTTPIQENCRCSKEMLSSVLLNMKAEDIQDLIKKDKGAELKCTFCNSAYIFTEEDLEAIIKAKE